MPAHHRAAEAVEADLAVGGPEDAKAPLSERRPGRPAERAAADAPGRAGHDQAAGVGGGAAGVDVLPRVSGDGDHGVPVERGMLEHAQRIAGRASPKTTKLYDRTAGTISLDEIERIVISREPARVRRDGQVIPINLRGHPSEPRRRGRAAASDGSPGSRSGER